MKILRSARFWRLLSLVFMSLVAVGGTSIYHIYKLNALGIFATLNLALAGSVTFFYYYLKNEQEKEITEPTRITRPLYGLLGSYLILLFSCFLVLFINRTDEAIISPWQKVPPYFFGLYFLLTLLLFALIWQVGNRRPKIALFALSGHALLSYFVALLVYRIGYGFDPFIHSATMEFIKTQGEVLPKPFYYIGYYSLVLAANKMLWLKISWLNSALVPVLAALYLPGTWFQSIKDWLGDKRIALLAIFSLMILPFPIFINTTPQNLAYVLVLILIPLALRCSSYLELVISYLLALAALSIHPVAGLPALIYVATVHLYHSSCKHKKTWYGAAFASNALLLPLLFLIFEKIPLAKIAELDWSKIGTISGSFLDFTVPEKESLLLNSSYLMISNARIWMLLLVLTGLVLAWRFRHECRAIWPSLLASGGLFLAYLISSVLPFGFLIDYERSDYSGRLLTMAAFFALPAVALMLYAGWEKLLAAELPVKIIFTIAISLSITVSLYASYPRLDNYFNSRGYSTGRSDLEAVDWINKDTPGGYIVLANQQVSVAALHRFGFNKYYKGDIYYYPIPTSGPLYQYYLDMAYKEPNRKTMIAAMDMAGVDTGYFVLNEYWWAFSKIRDEAKLSADSYEELGDGEIFVFKYKKAP